MKRKKLCYKVLDNLEIKAVLYTKKWLIVATVVPYYGNQEI